MNKRFARAAALLSCSCVLFQAAWSNAQTTGIVESEKATVKVAEKATKKADETVYAVDYESALKGVNFGEVVRNEVDLVESEATDTTEYGYSNLGLADVDTYLNVRAEASTASDIVGIMSDNSACEIEEISDGWAKVTSGEVSGYVSTDYIITGVQAKKTAENIVNNSVTVNTNLLCVREDSSVDSQVISQAKNGTVLSIATRTEGDSTEADNPEIDVSEEESDSGGGSVYHISTGSNTTDAQSEEDPVEDDTDSGDDEWIEVAIDEETVGFVYAEYVTQVTELDTASPVVYRTAAASSSDDLNSNAYAEEDEYSGDVESTVNNDAVVASGTGSAVANFALQFVGCPYVWGGTSLSGGSDCSGFVMSVYANFGVSLPHSSSAQSGYGVSVSASDAQPGDLFFYGAGGVNHVGIYIGNGQIVHSSTPETGVRVSNAFYESPVCIKRLL